MQLFLNTDIDKEQGHHISHQQRSMPSSSISFMYDIELYLLLYYNVCSHLVALLKLAQYVQIKKCTINKEK